MTIFSTSSSVQERYGYNLTKLARESTFSPLNASEAWVSQIFSILLRKEKTRQNYNPVLIDGDETRRWQVILEVVRRLITGNAPAPLSSLQVVAPNLAALCRTSSSLIQQEITGTASEVEARLVQLLLWPSSDLWSTSDIVLTKFEEFFSAVCQSEDRVLILLNDFQRFVGGDPQPYAIDIANVLVPA